MKTVAYSLISEWYGDKAAKRTDIPLMNHIDEGLVILRRLNACQDALDAFCLHPLFQEDEALTKNLYLIEDAFGYDLDLAAVCYALEYRNIANRYLSDKVSLSENGQPVFDGEIILSPIPEVNQMLIADKVQNNKDFHANFTPETHPRHLELTYYFNYWLAALGVDHDMYCQLVEGLPNA